MPHMGRPLPPDYWKEKFAYEDRTDPHKNLKRWGDGCHCHNDCKACQKYPDKPNTICKHCKPEAFTEDKLTPFRKEMETVLNDYNFDMCGEECGWNHYGHKGYYCRCSKEEGLKEEIEELLKVFRKYKSIL